MKGLVNAVLRKLSSYEIEAWNEDESICKLPSWLRDPLIDTYGKTTVVEIEKIQTALDKDEIEITKKEASYKKIDELKKQAYDRSEEVLLDILPVDLQIFRVHRIVF